MVSYLYGRKENNGNIQHEIDCGSGDHLIKDVQTGGRHLLDGTPPKFEIGTAAEDPNNLV